MRVSGTTRNDWAADEVERLAFTLVDLCEQIDRLRGDVGLKTFAKVEAAAPLVRTLDTTSHFGLIQLARELRGES